MRTATTWTMIALIFGCLSTGCRPGPTELAMPEDFVELDEQRRGEYDVRGMSADGVVLGLRRHDNLDNGTLAFWQQALHNELINRGYKLQAPPETVTSGGGVDGKLMTFKTTSRGTEFLYVLAMYVQPRTVTTVEAGGKADAVREHMDEILKSVRSAR